MGLRLEKEEEIHKSELEILYAISLKRVHHLEKCTNTGEDSQEPS